MIKCSNDEWVKRVHDKYGSRFDTSLVDYKGSYHKVTLRCVEHNELFECDPVSLLRTSTKGDFCPKCRDNKKLTQQEFREKAELNYGHMYNLDKIEFSTVRDNVTLGCPVHGDFEVRARYVSSNDSLELCPKCKDLNKNLGHLDYIKRYTEDKELGSQPGIFYKLLITHKPTNLKFIKVGITSVGLDKRFQSKQYDDFDIEELEVVNTTNLESALLEEKFKHDNMHQKFLPPKALRFEGYTECYLLDEVQELESKDLKFIRSSYLEAQGGVCAICGKPPKIPVVDHWHQKKNSGDGCIRGVLCSTCNVMVAVVENNLVRKCINYSDAIEWLRSLAKYLEAETYNLLHPTEKEVEKIGKRAFNDLMNKYIEKYPKRSKLKYPKNGKVGKRLDEIIKEFND